MIKVNELRIGNWIYQEDKDHPKRHYEISSCYDIEKFDDFPEQGEPIPLTPDILEEKCGFSYMCVEGISRLSEYVGEEEEKGDTHNWTMSINQSDYCDRFRFEIVKWGEQEYFTFSNQWLRIRIKYLHQLQNLYFALTNTELEISL